MRVRHPRVGLIGSFSVGKTTLQNRLAAMLSDIPIIAEGSRSIAGAWGYTPASIPGNMLWEFQASILYRQVAQERLHHDTGFITDTSTIDNSAWMMFLAATGLSIPAEVKQAYLDIAARRVRHYDILLLLPPIIDLEDDGARHTNVQLREEIHTRVLAMLAYFEVHGGVPLEAKTHPLWTDTPDERLSEALEIIGRWRPEE